MKKLLFLIPVILGGCQTVEPYSQKLDAMIGLTETELVQKFGKPAEIITTDKTTQLIYQKTRTNYTPGIAQPYMTPGQLSSSINPGIMGEYEYTTCDTVFTLENNKVIDWKYRGTCYSY